MIAFVIKTLLAYALGSLSGSLLVGSLRHVDIRLAGSGSAGGTNAFRTQGFRFALAVVIIDIGKGALAAGMLPLMRIPGLPETVLPAHQALACAAAAIVGHCYPLWHGFRGGKGAGTAVGALCVLQPAVLIPMFLVWLLALGLTGWVGLATICAGLSVVPAMLWLDAASADLVFAAGLAAFLIFTHRANIRRMREGSEYRFERAMIRNWFT